MTPRTYLVRGLLAGLIAGLLTFAVAYTVGEPQVDAAISIEENGAPAGHGHSLATHGGGGDDALVSRADQSTFGLATATVVMGLVLGGAVGIAAAFAVGRLGRLTPSQSTAAVAAIGFVAFALVPFLKYPANPPAVGDPETINSRTALFWAFILVSVVAAVAAVVLGSWLSRRFGAYRGVLGAIAAFLVVVVAVGYALPTVNEIGDFPGDTLWYFRRASLVTQATMWASIGVVLAGLVGKEFRTVTADAERRDLAASL